MRVELSRFSAWIGKAAAVGRVKYARGKPDQCGQNGVNPEHHRLGSLCEVAFADEMNLFWNGTVGAVNREDVAEFYGVRGVTAEHHHLIAHGEEKDRPDVLDHPLVSVYQESETVYWLRGWMFARDAIAVGEFTTKRGPDGMAFFVPWPKLEPMAVLPLIEPTTWPWR